MKRALIFLLALLLPLLGGCQSVQLDKKALCLMLAVDEKEGETLLTAVFPKLTGGQKDEAEYTQIAVTAQDLEQALDKLRAATPYQLCFEQLRLLALGEKVTRKDVSPIIHTLCAVPRTRMSAAVLVAGGEASEFVEAIKPDFGNRVSKFLSFKLDKLARQGLTPRATLGRTQRELISGRQDCLLIYGRVNKKVKQKIEEEKQKNQQQDQASQPAFQQAGELLEQSDDAAEIYGACALSKGRFARALTGEEHRILISLGDLKLENGRVIAPKDSRESAVRLLEELFALGSDPLGVSHQAAMMGKRDFDEILKTLTVEKAP